MDNESKYLPLVLYILGMHDPYGEHHAHRVAHLSERLARAAGIDDEQTMKDIEIASLLHDIGKIGIPEVIRRMPGKYTYSEMVVMEQHPVLGVYFLSKIPNGGVGETVINIVRGHHENWNGAGYPDGLRGNQIPLGARIIRITDTFDAMTHERGYKSGLSKGEALQEMMDDQIRLNGWADPDLLRLFIELIRKEK